MQSFFDRMGRVGPSEQGEQAEEASAAPVEEDFLPANPSARLAIYDSLTSLPRIVDLSAEGCEQFVNLIATRTYELSQERGGQVPFTIIKEVVENLIHACFNEAVITILDRGNTIRISDQGPGIGDPERAFQPGFSTATAEMKRVIKGVGSGLPIVRECLTLSGGDITIENNLARGTVVTLRMPEPKQPVEPPTRERPEGVALTTRQKKVLFLVTELGAAGPSTIARELHVALSTAYRDLTALEGAGLVACDDSGKRSLTAMGVRCLDEVLES